MPPKVLKDSKFNFTVRTTFEIQMSGHEPELHADDAQGDHSTRCFRLQYHSLRRDISSILDTGYDD
jgi:hypothetical protein